MQRLDPKSFFIFYFEALQRIFILLLVTVPLIIFVSIPAYLVFSLSDKQYLFTRFLFTYTLLCVFFLCFLPFLWAYLAFLMSTMEVDKHHVSFKKGTIMRKIIDVPYSQIQSISIIKNPMLDLLGLCSIEIEMSDQSQNNPLRLSGLNVDQAHYIRSLYLESSEAA